MGTFKKLIIGILFISLTSCLSTVPSAKFEGYTKSKGQYDIKVALIIPKEFKSYVYYFTIVGSCGVSKVPGAPIIQQGQTHAKNDVGIAAEELLVKGLPSIFKKVDIYEDISEIKDEASYDYILRPTINAGMSYDSDEARKRKLEDDLNIKAIIELGLKVQDVKSNAIIKDLSSKFTYIGGIPGDTWDIPLLTRAKRWGFECSRRFDHYDRLLGSTSSRLFGEAISNAFLGMLELFDEHMKPIIQAKAQEQALPSSLSLAIRFSDDSSFSPNKVLDAGEEAQVFVTVKNDGKGAGYGTVLKVASENPRVTVDKEIPLDDIPPGGTKEVKVNVKAGLDIQDGTVPFIITCSEKRGYDCKKYTLNVQAAHYEKPELVITGYKLNDTTTGLGQGNGNGIPENGETIEIIPLVKNIGTGPAFNVTLSLQSVSSGLELKQGSTTIPQILPGQVGTGNLAFIIPTTFSGRSIDLTISASDIRGTSGTNRQFALATEINQPSLAYTYRIIDQKGNSRSDIQNGEHGEIEIRPANKGRMDARNISIDLASEAVSFSKTHDEILRIGPQSEYTPVRFPFQVPRVTDRKSADITLKFTQKDFPGMSDSINIPIRLVRPEFRIIHQLLVQNKSGVIEQGENGELLVQVENIGHLDANNVVFGMSVLEKGVRIEVPKEVNLGKIEAGRLSEQKRFPIHVQRSVSPGELPIHFTISEQHFGTKNMTLALNVAKEQAEVITVKGQERLKQSVPIAQYNLPPTIVIATPYDNEKVASETVVLKGIASDDKAVYQIEIRVNGRSVEGRGIKVSPRVIADPREREIFENVALQAGKNTIIVTAYDNEHLSTSKTITVYRESKKGTIWAAVIGINKYQDPKLNLK